jgi:hypothetical protein
MRIVSGPIPDGQAHTIRANPRPTIHCQRCGDFRPHTYQEERRIKSDTGHPTGWEQRFACNTCDRNRRYGVTKESIGAELLRERCDS